MDEKLIERVARAIATSEWKDVLDEYHPGDAERLKQADTAYYLTNNSGRYRFDNLARAAIQSMIDAGWKGPENKKAPAQGQGS